MGVSIDAAAILGNLQHALRNVDVRRLISPRPQIISAHGLVIRGVKVEKLCRDGVVRKDPPSLRQVLAQQSGTFLVEYHWHPKIFSEGGCKRAVISSHGFRALAPCDCFKQVSGAELCLLRLDYSVECTSSPLTSFDMSEKFCSGSRW